MHASHSVAMGLHSAPPPIAFGAMSQCHTGEGHRWSVAPKILPSFFCPPTGNTNNYSRRGPVLKLLPAYLLSWFTYPSLSKCCLHGSIFSVLIKTLRRRVGYQNSPQSVRTIACLRSYLSTNTAIRFSRNPG